MLMKPEPLFEAVEQIRPSAPGYKDLPVVLLTPQGVALTQQHAEQLARHQSLVLICGAL